MKLNYSPLFLALALPAAAQQAAIAPIEETPGSYSVTMPAEPHWHNHANGQSIVRMTVHVPGAAACRMTFAYLGLAKGEAMYIHAARNTAHGPYLGHGPVNRPDFESMWLPGDTFAVTATGRPAADFPFLLHSLRCLDADQLQQSPVPFSRSFTPSPGAEVTNEALARIDDHLVRVSRHNGVSLFEGDIVIPEDSPASGKNPNRESMQIIGASRAWPNFRIPYANSLPKFIGYGDLFEPNPAYNDVEQAIGYWNSRFPGLLVPATSGAPDVVVFRQASDVCQSSVGRVGGTQYVDLDPSCGEAAVRHEIGHVLGFWHEQSRQDRESFVTINWDNIRSGKSGNFALVDVNSGRNYGNYDYGSLMHYSAYTFSSNGKPTITPLQPMPAGVTMGMATALSATDLNSARNLICNVWFVAPAGPTLDGLADQAGIQIVLPSYCPWTAHETASWLSLSKTSGTGPAIIEVSATSNPMAFRRQANITINGKTVTVTQNRRDY